MLSLRRKFLAVYGHDQVPPVGLDELKRLSGSKQKPSVGYGAANLLIPDSYGGGVGGSQWSDTATDDPSSAST